LESTPGRSWSSTANPSSYTSTVACLRLDVTPAHQQLRPRTPHNRIDVVVQQHALHLTLVNNGDQQHAEHTSTSLAKLFHCFLSWSCLTAHTKFHLL
jgi:hypothetical protein